MKKISLLLGFFTICSLISFAQKPFVGTITYNIECSSEEELDAQVKAGLPTTLILATDGKKTRSETVTPMFSMATITDLKNESGLLLFDITMIGQKLKAVLSKEYMAEQKAKAELEKNENNQKPTINYIEESKTIAGYKCQKAEITDEEGNTTEIFYTKDIILDKNLKDNIANFAEGLDGIALEWTMVSSGITMKFTAKEISPKKPKAIMFLADDDYNEVTLDELKQMLGGAEE